MKRLFPLIAAALAACTPAGTNTPVAVPEPAPATPAVSSPAPVAAAPAPAIAPAKPVGPLDAYKQRAALRILQASNAHVYEGAPPHMLKSIVVLTLAIDARGNVTSSRVLRGNGHKDLEQLALASVKRAAPFDPPPRQLLRNNSLEVVETWLFREDGKFQVRSVALPQPAVPADEADLEPPRKPKKG